MKNKEVKEEIIKEMKISYITYKQKHPNRKMTLKELDKLCRIGD